MYELPIISIVTPSFNQAEYLEECIESVLSQGYPRLEYVIMDGGSTDGSTEIIKKYEKYLTYWQSCPDGGQYRAINEGFRHTSGSIMAWLNSDDKYHPLAFAKVVCAFEKSQEACWLTGRKSFWDAAGNLTQVEDELAVFSRRKFLEGHFNKPYIQQESTFWKRSLWEQAGAALDENISLAGDLELWCRFFRFAQLYTVDALLGGYRFHEGQRGALFADEYRNEAEQCIGRERNLYCDDLLGLAAPPQAITLGRNQLSTAMQKQEIKPLYPSNVGCWCEYTEDLMAICSGLLQERKLAMIKFWENEVSLFSLIKPRTAWLLSDTFSSLNSLESQMREMLEKGEQHEAKGAYSSGLALYRAAAEIAPGNARVMEHLIQCYWKMGDQREALRLLADSLAKHAHDAGVVRIACQLLSSCGAFEQAKGVCNEYLMVNPHDELVCSLRNLLGA